MKLRPMLDYVLAERLKPETVSKGGIALPEESQKKPDRAIVVAVGNGHLLDDGGIVPLEVKIGDSILFSKHSGTEIVINNSEHLILKEHEILGIYVD